jgi:large subunit ribosomal protein L5e
MGFVKIVKNKAYSKRMQVKPKRRRQCKTDFYARRRLVQQDKNKYDSKKYRLVVRRTNAKFITQIIFSTMTGDRVLCAAESTELKAHGLTAGLTNYASAYATGLLLARRLLKQVGLSDLYKATTDVNGEYFNIDDDADDDKRPFKALLDVGLQRTTTGARIFGVLKGACDGGINVPHKTKRFPGYSRAQVTVIENKRGKSTGSERVEAKFDAKAHRARIFGNHVTDYMKSLQKEDGEKFKRQFSNWSKCLAAAKVKTCEDLYKKVHTAVIANPDRVKKAANTKFVRKVIQKQPKLIQENSKGKKWIRHFRITTAARRENAANKLMNQIKLVSGQ